MHANEIITLLGLLAFVVAITALSRRSVIPAPTLMVVAGLLIGLTPGLPSFTLSPDLVFILFLPPILYGAAWDTWWADFRRHIGVISLLAFGLVFATAAAVASISNLLFGLPMWVGFLLGAIVSPPDAAAATAICQRLGVSQRIVTVLEGESLVNDASGLIAYRIALAAIVTGQFSIGTAAANLLIAAVGGVAIGIAVGFIVAQLHKRLDDPNVTTALSLLAPYMAYLPAEQAHTSGVLATVAAGLYVSHRSTVVLNAASRLHARAVWEQLLLLVNGAIFVLIGLQLRSLVSTVEYLGARLLWYGAAVSLTVIAVRMAWVFLTPALPGLLRAGRPADAGVWQARVVIGWTGMRGIVSLAAALAIPLTTRENMAFPYRDLIIVLTFGVIFSTLVLQSLTLPWLIRKLGDSVAAGSEHEEVVTRMMSASAAVGTLDRLIAESKDAADPGLNAVRNEYLDRINLSVGELRGELASQGRGRASPEDPARLVAIGAQREFLDQMRQRGEISEEVFRRIERDLDLEEARLR